MTDKFAETLNDVNQDDKKRQEQKQKLKRENDLDDLKYLMQSHQGRRFFWRLLGHCSVYNSIFNTNALVQSHNSGKQDVGHFVQGEIIQASPDGYLKMQSEHQIKENKF